MDITFKKCERLEEAPMDLLLLADPAEEAVLSYLNKGFCFTAEHAGVTVGVILYMETGPGVMEIMNVAVRPDLHNKGIGRQLILHALNEIRKTDTRTVEIGTGNPGVVQMLLYQKCGFRIVGIDFDFFRRHYPEPIIENGIECRDMIRLRMEL